MSSKIKATVTAKVVKGRVVKLRLKNATCSAEVK